MTTRTISFSQPLRRAWERTKDLLFRPFDVKTWLVLGFTAWLARLGDCGSGGGGDVSLSAGDVDEVELDGVADAIGSSLRSLLESPLWLGLAAFGCLTLIVLVIALLWVSSRGKMMFLDNVVHRRALVVDPWRRLGALGDSLFLFRLFFLLISVGSVGGLLTALVAAVGFSFWTEVGTVSALLIGATGAVLFVLLIVAILFTAFFLDAFVLPLMHRYDLGVVDGWRRFLALLKVRPWPFVLCGLFVLVLAVVAGILVLATGLATCCVGFLFMIIPYVGTVLLLPIPVFFRSFTLEFLAQFEDDLLPAAAVPPPPKSQSPPVSD